MEIAEENRYSTLFLCGDVMTGRGIDQIFPQSAPPFLFEPYVKDAHDYVKLAEIRNGLIERPVPFAYIWGDALPVLDRLRPALRLINLETSVTLANQPWSGKSIHYRMHPQNLGCLTAAQIDMCALANNHVLDWGYSGLRETLETLPAAGIRCMGAGINLSQAQQPVILPLREHSRVIVFPCGSPDNKRICNGWRKPLAGGSVHNSGTAAG